ncbi:P-loop containing nucleoside triphosphate hydrolase protein [Tricholoma matsutake]|nr:P-loop containing nucleoside triphosphate hydrolase protein [Tricholoma matsutake 945]
MEIEESWPSNQIVLILCGLVASGKSTFAEQLQQHFPQFHRCNQDDLGDRRRVEQLARAILARGKSVCIDRTNFNDSQRSHWIKIAREYPGTLIWVIVFDTPYEVCAARLQSRTSHPTIKSPEQGLSILSRFAADFQYPGAHEGHERIISLKPGDHTSAVYSRFQIAAILQRVHDSPPVMAHTSLFLTSRGRRSFQNHSFRGHPLCSDFGPGNIRMPRGRDDAVVGSMNESGGQSRPVPLQACVPVARTTIVISLNKDALPEQQQLAPSHM